jgi:protein-S-isoprenylcysteine O-methyltransferase Ste14
VDALGPEPVRLSFMELKVPPLVLVLLMVAAMSSVARLVPSLAFSFANQWLVIILLAAAGALISLAGVWEFRRAHTTVDPTHPEKSSDLVVSGIYQRSRNPMYIGFLLTLAAWAFHVSNLLAFAALPIFIAYMNRFQITPEERALRARFGSAYAEYEKSVRRWL